MVKITFPSWKQKGARCQSDPTASANFSVYFHQADMVLWSRKFYSYQGQDSSRAQSLPPNP